MKKGEMKETSLRTGRVAEGLHEVIDCDELDGRGRGGGVQIRAWDGDVWSLIDCSVYSGRSGSPGLNAKQTVLVMSRYDRPRLGRSA